MQAFYNAIKQIINFISLVRYHEFHCTRPNKELSRTVRVKVKFRGCGLRFNCDVESAILKILPIKVGR